MKAEDVKKTFLNIPSDQSIWIKLDAIYAMRGVESFLREWCDDRLFMRNHGCVRLIAELSEDVMANLSPGSLGALTVIHSTPPNWTCILNPWKQQAVSRWLINEQE